MTQPKPAFGRRAGISGLLVSVGLLFLYCMAISSQGSSAATDDKFKITPTKSEQFGTGFYVPKDLDDAFLELEKMLSIELKTEMRKGSEDAMSMHHHGLGMWMRNNWGLWKGSRLSKWFNKQRIFHPDDMSGIVLTSYWRKVNKKPIELEKQIKSYQNFWAEAAKEKSVEEKRVASAKAKLKRMMLSTKYSSSSPVSIIIPKLVVSSFRIRYAAEFAGGLIVTGKWNDPKIHDEWVTRSYFVDLQNHDLRLIQVPEMDQIEESVVVNDTAYIHGFRNKKHVVLEVSPQGRKTLSLPKESSFRLGIDYGKGDSQSLIAVGKSYLARWQGGVWTSIPTGEAQLPDCHAPAKLYQNRLYLRDEGEEENGRTLWWLDLKTKALSTFDKSVGVVNASGPRWEDVWSFVKTSNGRVWFAVGSKPESVLSWLPGRGYRIALMNGGLSYVDDFFGTADSPDGNPRHRLEISGLALDEAGSVLAIGTNGLFRLSEKTIEPIAWFDGATLDSAPTTLLPLGNGRFFVADEWGGCQILSIRGGIGASRVVTENEKTRKAL